MANPYNFDPLSQNIDLGSEEFRRWLHKMWSLWRAIIEYEVTYDPASIAANTTAEDAVTVTGVAAGDEILAVVKPTLTAGVAPVHARVSAADTVQVTWVNATAGAVDPGSETYKFIVLKERGTR